MKYTLAQIEENPIKCFESMTARELQKFEEGYYKRIRREADRVLKLRKEQEIRDMREEYKQQVYQNKVLALYHRIAHLHLFDESEEFISFHGRCVGNTIHDLPAIWTGFMSANAISTEECCNEHFYPRQWSGEYIVNYILKNKGISVQALRRILDVFRLVHKVTPTENRELMKHQNSDEFISPKRSYEQAGIQLIHVKDTGVEFEWL